MRTRTRTLTSPTPSTFGTAWKREWIITHDPDVTIYGTGNALSTGDTSFPMKVKSETMSDINTSDLSLKLSNRSAKKHRGFTKSINSGAIPADMIGKFKEFLPVNPVSHSKTALQLPAAELITVSETYDGPSYNVVHSTFTKSYPSPGTFIRSLTGSDPLDWFNANKDGYSSAYPYGLHDWFHLTDKFNEAIDSFMPSNLLLGETLIENAIFRDAFSLLVNPSNAIKLLIRSASRLTKKQRGQTLGQLASFAKGTSNSWLSYNFGVKPAIQDIVSILNAHSNVSTRMKYLSSNSGSYIPIRVRNEIRSPITNVKPTNVSSGNSFLYCHRDHKIASANIGCWGRVRDDLTYDESWKAYFQYFGIGKVLQLGWELIPFSFVVDWVTDTQEVVNSISRRLTPSFSPFCEIKALSASVSKEEKFSINFFADREDGGGPPYISPMRFKSMKIASATISSYDRYPRIPTTSGVVDLSTLGSFQAIASGALIIQRAIR